MAVSEVGDGSLCEHVRVHRALKRSKRLRSMYRLFQRGFTEYPLENATVRDAARRLSDFRDSMALIEAFDKLTQPSRTEAGGAAACRIRRRLIKYRDELAADHDLTGELETFKETMEGILARVHAWRLDPSDRAEVLAGLFLSHARARARMSGLSSRSSPEELHAWRKRAKSHTHHLLVLQDAAHVPGARLGAMQSLCTALGDHHDLHVLRRRLETMDSLSGAEEELESLLEVITARQDALAAKALAAGGRLFGMSAAADRPDLPYAASELRGTGPFGSSAGVRPAAL